MPNQNRFYYARSVVYGWCVYDRDMGSIPAYEACSELLPMRVDPEDGSLYAESPVLLTGEYHAMRLCHKLNAAHRRAMKEVAQ